MVDVRRGGPAEEPELGHPGQGARGVPAAGASPDGQVGEPRKAEDVEREGAEKAAAELNELRARNAKLMAEVDELKALAGSAAEGPKDLQRLHLLQIQPVRDVLVIMLVVGVFWLGYVLRP